MAGLSGDPVMFVANRLATLRQHLDHLDQLRPIISGPAALAADLSLSNDVRWSLFTVCRAVLDLAGTSPSRDHLRVLEIDPARIVAAINDLGPLDDFAQILATTQQPSNSGT